MAKRKKRAPARSVWEPKFLAALGNTSNVSKAAREAGISTSTAYGTRRKDAEFNRKWQEALCEGYDNLEMETLERLRYGQVKPAAGAKRGTRTFDNASSIRLLNAHRDSVTKTRAQRANTSVADIRESIDRKVEAMRKRVEAREEAEKQGRSDA